MSVATAVLPIENVSQDSKTDATIKPRSQTESTNLQFEVSTVGISPTSSNIEDENRKPIDITEVMETSMDNCVSILQEALIDFYPYLSRTFLGTNGQDLLREGRSTIY